MAERKAVNKYYPPEWEPSHGSLNHHVKKKGNVPQKSGIGLLSDHKLDTTPPPPTTKRIRFELPMPVWCAGCHRHIAKNVRFNADKRQTSHYHTTPILQFAFRCPSCPQEIVLETVPSEATYKVVSGATAKTETPDVADTITTGDVEGVSAFAKVERDLERREREAEERPKLERLLETTDRLWQNDFCASQMVRQQFRERRRAERRMAGGDPVGAALKRFGIERVGDSSARAGAGDIGRKDVGRVKRKPFSDW